VGYVHESALARFGGDRLHDSRGLDYRRLVTHYVLFAIELATRKVVCAGITPYPGSAWILQVGRNLTDAFTGFLCGKSLLIMDRDSSFHPAFRGLLESAGVRPVRTPARSPNCNAHLEQFHGSFKREVAERMIFFGEDHLRRAMSWSRPGMILFRANRVPFDLGVARIAHQRWAPN